ncbi:MAG: hypothetical protein K9W44_04630 [Candidatus Lokiarchaeota archaeon]|nr:hypothetical protein [Candidatus Harpocratesius repetitus]
MSNKSELKEDLEKRKREIISHNKAIIQKANEVFVGKIDPFDVNIDEEIQILRKIRNIIGDEDDLKRGITGYESINDINSKQQEKLNNIITEKSDPRWQLRNKQLHNFLKNKKKFDNFQENFIIPLLNQEKDDLKIAIPIHVIYPVILPDNYFQENKEVIRKIYHSLEIKRRKDENIIEVPLSESQEFTENNIEANEFYDQIMEIFETLKEEKEIKLLKFILSTNYMETLMRLQAISYLVSNNYIEIIPSSEDEIEESGMYKIIIQPNSKKKSQEDNYSSTIILGITYDEWKALQPFIKKGDLSKRPILMNLG